MSEYIYSADVPKLVRAELKEALPGWKFSVTRQSFANGSSIDLSLMSGPEVVTEGGEDYVQLNPYQFQRPERNYEGINNGVFLTPKGWDVMAKATSILAKYHRDDSDSQSDYFSCNFYIHINIGKWDKPYAVKESK